LVRVVWGVRLVRVGFGGLLGLGWLGGCGRCVVRLRVCGGMRCFGGFWWLGMWWRLLGRFC
jgi:hypothetical protein